MLLLLRSRSLHVDFATTKNDTRITFKRKMMAHGRFTQSIGLTKMTRGATEISKMNTSSILRSSNERRHGCHAHADDIHSHLATNASHHSHPIGSHLRCVASLALCHRSCTASSGMLTTSMSPTTLHLVSHTVSVAKALVVGREPCCVKWAWYMSGDHATQDWGLNQNPQSHWQR